MKIYHIKLSYHILLWYFLRFNSIMLYYYHTEWFFYNIPGPWLVLFWNQLHLMKHLSWITISNPITFEIWWKIISFRESWVVSHHESLIYMSPFSILYGGKQGQIVSMVIGQTSSNIQKVMSKYLTVLQVTTSQNNPVFPAGS